MKNLRILSTLALSFFTAAVAFAAPPPPPNLSVLPCIGNANPVVESAYQYTTRVRNIGKLPAVSISSGTCSTAGNKITCNVGSPGNNQTKSVTFTYEQHFSTVAPFMKTTASTSSTNEQNANNNQLSLNLNVSYPTNEVTGLNANLRDRSQRGQHSFDTARSKLFWNVAPEHAAEQIASLHGRKRLRNRSDLQRFCLERHLLQRHHDVPAEPNTQFRLPS